MHRNVQHFQNFYRVFTAATVFSVNALIQWPREDSREREREREMIERGGGKEGGGGENMCAFGPQQLNELACNFFNPHRANGCNQQLPQLRAPSTTQPRKSDIMHARV